MNPIKYNPINFNLSFGSSSNINPYVNQSGASYGGQVSAGVGSNKAYKGYDGTYVGVGKCDRF